MADEVEVVDVGHVLLGLHLLEVDALRGEKVADDLLLFLGVPAADEVVEGGVAPEDARPRVVDDALLAEEPAAGVVDLDALPDDADAASRRVDDESVLPLRRVGVVGGRVRLADLRHGLRGG